MKRVLTVAALGLTVGASVSLAVLTVTAPSIVNREVRPRAFPPSPVVPLPVDASTAPAVASPAPLARPRASRERLVLSPARPTPTPLPRGNGVPRSPSSAASVVTGSNRPDTARERTGRYAMWVRLMHCESPGRGWRYGAPGVGSDKGFSQYEGAFDFLPSTWRAHGGLKYAAHAYDATPDEQIAVAEETLRVEGVRAWPICGPRVGLVKR